MGRENSPSVSRLTPYNVSPETDEIEVTLIGPGYGECALIHIGKRRWVIVDSCLDGYGQPAALAYLSDLGLNPSEVVCLVVGDPLARRPHTGYEACRRDVRRRCLLLRLSFDRSGFPLGTGCLGRKSGHLEWIRCTGAL